MTQILIVDDNPDIIEALDLLLSLHGYKVRKALNKKEAILAASRFAIDIVIQDMNFDQGITSGNEGKQLFRQLRELKPDLPIILITAWAQLETAIELVKSGATDYLQKPWDDIKLLELVAKYSLRNNEIEPVDSKSLTRTCIQALIYQSAEMHALIADANKVAVSEVNVLITGANGSGKEKLADHIHQQSLRKAAPFIKVNMGALPKELMEAELFGAEKGAFTGANQSREGRFEAAHGGTLFLDEIGNLSLAGQMKLLRVLQTGEFERLGSNQTIKVDVRVFSATNVDLIEAVKNGTFREDLYYRLNVIELHLPALNKRKADIIPLANHFMGSDYSINEDAKQFLLANTWQGNVRELENACKRAKVFAADNHITRNDFTNLQRDSQLKNEQQQIEAALIKHAGVIKHTANELGYSRQALYRRIEKYNIDVESLC
jgi:DNA-binding NtrC family response regulator